MSRRRRIVVLAGGVACLVLAGLLLALARDVSRWDRLLERDDVRFGAQPDAPLWRASTILPASLSRDVLGLRDDVDFREALRAFRLGRLGEGASSDPAVVLQRGEALARLQAIAGGGGDARIRSRAMNLAGVLAFASALSETRDQLTHLQDAAAGFTVAIGLDPANDEAKANLELVLQRGRQVQLSESSGGPNPSPGGSGAKGAGAGDPGTGY